MWVTKIQVSWGWERVRLEKGARRVYGIFLPCLIGRAAEPVKIIGNAALLFLAAGGN